MVHVDFLKGGTTVNEEDTVLSARCLSVWNGSGNKFAFLHVFSFNIVYRSFQESFSSAHGGINSACSRSHDEVASSSPPLHPGGGNHMPPGQVTWSANYRYHYLVAFSVADVSSG